MAAASSGSRSHQTRCARERRPRAACWRIESNDSADAAPSAAHRSRRGTSRTQRTATSGGRLRVDSEQPLPRRCAPRSCRNVRLAAAACTPASVRPAPCTVTVSSATASTAAGERDFDAASASLRLPADEVGAVVFESQRDSRHIVGSVAMTSLDKQRARRVSPAARCGLANSAASLGAQNVDQASAPRGAGPGSPSSSTSSRMLRAPSGIAHVDVGAREIELRANLGHRLRIEGAHFLGAGRIVRADELGCRRPCRAAFDVAAEHVARRTQSRAAARRCPTPAVPPTSHRDSGRARRLSLRSDFTSEVSPD